MMFTGAAGTGKTMSATMVTELIDPIGMNSACNILPDNTTTLAMMLNMRQSILFDHVSRITPSVNDMLCMACTGGAHTVRKIYTTNEMITIPLGRMRVLFTCVDKSIISRPDLASRVLHYEMMPEQTNVPKSQLVEEYIRNRPYILHDIFSTISKAMNEYETNKKQYDEMQTSTSMMEFEQFGSAIAYVLGDKKHDAIKEYQKIMCMPQIQC